MTTNPLRLMTILKQTLTVLLVAYSCCPGALALAVGDIKLMSAVGDPLLATIALNDTGGLNREEIHIRQAPLEIYEDLGVGRDALYKTLLFTIDKNKVITISSPTPIKEPFLHFVIQLRWPKGQVYREVKLLLDPPSPVN